MSYNITSVKIKQIELTVPRDFLFEIGDFETDEDYGQIMIGGWGGYSEPKRINDNQLFKLVMDGDGSEIIGEIIGKEIKITDFNCSSSNSSGEWILSTIKELCVKYKQSLKATIVWEGGDSIEYINIQKGVDTSRTEEDTEDTEDEE